MPPACYLLPTCYQLSASAFQHVSFQMYLMVNPWFLKKRSASRDAAIWDHLPINIDQRPFKRIHPLPHHTSPWTGQWSLTSSPKTQSRTWWGVDTSVTSSKMGWLLWWTEARAVPFFDLAWIRKLWLCTWIHLIPTEQEVRPLTYHSLRHSTQRTSQRPHWLWECLAGSWNSRSFSNTLRMCSWSMEALLGRVHPHQFGSYIHNVGLVWPALNSSNFWHIHFFPPTSGVVDLPSLSFSTMLARFSRASHWKLQQLRGVLLLNCFISQMIQEDWCSQLCPTTTFWHWVSLI